MKEHEAVCRLWLVTAGLLLSSVVVASSSCVPWDQLSSREEVESLDASCFESATAAALRDLPGSLCIWISGRQASRLPGDSCSGLSSDCASNCSLDALSALSSSCVSCVSGPFLSSLSPNQVGSISVTSLAGLNATGSSVLGRSCSGLTWPQAPALSASAWSGFGPECAEAIDREILFLAESSSLAAASSRFLSALNATKVARIRDVVWSKFGPEQAAAFGPWCSGITVYQASYANGTTVCPYLTAQCLSLMKQDSFGVLSPECVHSLGPQQLWNLSLATISRLRFESVLQLRFDVWVYLCSRFGAEFVDSFSKSALYLASSDTIVGLRDLMSDPKSALKPFFPLCERRPSVYNSFSWLMMVTAPAADASCLPVDSAMVFNAFHLDLALRDDQVSHLLPEFLGNISNVISSRISLRITASQISRMSARGFSQLCTFGSLDLNNNASSAISSEQLSECSHSVSWPCSVLKSLREEVLSTFLCTLYTTESQSYVSLCGVAPCPSKTGFVDSPFFNLLIGGAVAAFIAVVLLIVIIVFMVRREHSRRRVPRYRPVAKVDEKIQL